MLTMTPSSAVATAASICFLVLCTTVASPAPRPLLQRQFLQTVPLDKQHVPVLRSGRVVAHKTAYFGTIFVGLPNPQPFTVLFDTGSGHAVLPSEHCHSDTCKKHCRYQRSLSGSAKDIEDNSAEASGNVTQAPQQVDLQYGTGEVSGEFLEESVCLGSDPNHTEARNGCTRLRVVLATSLTADPFEHFSFDGVVGLGLSTLSLDKDFSFVGRLVEAGYLPEPCFSVFLSKSDDPGKSEIAFGGHKQDLAVSDFNWAPVASPESGYWQVALQSVRIGDETLSLCAEGACRAVLDTGTSMLGVPEQSLSQLHRLLARMAEPTDDCRRLPGPPIVFDMGAFELRLNAEDYSRPTPMAVKAKSGNGSFTVCRASLLPVPADVGEEDGKASHVFVFGEPFLQKHYTKYDWDKHRIGFALAQQEQRSTSLTV